MTVEPDLNSVKMKQHAKYLGQRSLNSKIMVRTQAHTQTDWPPTLHPPLNWLLTNSPSKSKLAPVTKKDAK